MIEKITNQNQIARHKLAEKINELVDAVNELQTRSENVQPDAESRSENVQDEFAEQRKWIGKLCKFWDYDGEEKWFSILEHIDKNSPYTYCASSDWWYKHCEPVKPDDPIVYKGGDNE